MNIREYLKSDKLIYLDGGMGTILQEKGLSPGELPETWNIKNPQVIVDIHKSYLDAGSNIIYANTFGANSLKFSASEIEEIISSAIQNAKDAIEKSKGNQEKFIALDIGPTGRLLKPYGDLDFEEAVGIFSEVVKLGEKYGAHLIAIETMADSYETKAAILAAKENSDLPIFVTNAYGEDGKLMTGASPEAMVSMIEALGVDALGVNCSLGPSMLKEVIERIKASASLPLIIKPNAGLPKNVDGKTVYETTAEEFSDEMLKLISSGVKAIGGCCGTTPEYIETLVKKTKNIKAEKPVEKNATVISSYTHAVSFDDKPILIGERLNPTGKKLLKKALIEEDLDYILKEGISQEERGVHALDVNVGLPEIKEEELLPKVVFDLQSVINLPLCLDTSNYLAMEKALRIYNGKALINSVNGKSESMEKIFPLVAKYGGAVIALTLDDSGIPDRAQGRIDIARKIIARAEDYGINKKNIVFDALTLTISADPNAANTTLETVERIQKELGCHTVLGVSNVSFGLPNRDGINSLFFGNALNRGLSSAILNPMSDNMMMTYYSHRALAGLDTNFREYIEFSERNQEKKGRATEEVANAARPEEDLKYSILKGLKDQAVAVTEALLKKTAPLDIIENEVIPALNEVGKRFEEKTIYLPQLLMSAETAGASFDVIKKVMTLSADSDEAIPKGAGAMPGKEGAEKKVIVATVKGDIHDIGKNIVKLLLQNYGFDVRDLGKDVPPEEILDYVVREKVDICGLSALMTTTVPAMEETIKLLRDEAPWCKVIVGGAVLTRDYAQSIGADGYGKDAMETVRFVEKN